MDRNAERHVSRFDETSACSTAACVHASASHAAESFRSTLLTLLLPLTVVGFVLSSLSAIAPLDLEGAALFGALTALAVISGLALAIIAFQPPSLSFGAFVAVRHLSLDRPRKGQREASSTHGAVRPDKGASY